MVSFGLLVWACYSQQTESDLTDIDEEGQTTTGKHNIEDSSKHVIRNGRRGIEKQGQPSEAPTKALERAEYGERQRWYKDIQIPDVLLSFYHWNRPESW